MDAKRNACLLWESLIKTDDVNRMIEDADDVGQTLILKILAHCLNKGIVKQIYWFWSIEKLLIVCIWFFTGVERNCQIISKLKKEIVHQAVLLDQAKQRDRDISSKLKVTCLKLASVKNARTMSRAELGM